MNWFRLDSVGFVKFGLDWIFFPRWLPKGSHQKTSTNWCILVAKLNFPSKHERLFAIILLDIYPNTKKMALVQKVSAKAR